jgi:hypothetical protein
MFRNIITQNSRFLQESLIVIVVCFLCSVKGYDVLGQLENETSPINKQAINLDWLSAASPYLVTAATLTATLFIGPFIAKRWNDHRLEIELKDKIVAEINDCVMKTLVTIMKVEEFYNNPENQKVYEQLPDLERARNDQYYKEFKVNSHVIQSEIQAYSKRSLKEWNILIDLVQFVERLSHKEEPGEREHYINCCLRRDKWLNAYEPY